VRRFISCVRWVFILALWTGVAWGEPGEVIEPVGKGEVNWSQGTLVAKGSGAPPKEARNIAQARLMTERAALTDARRNLLEVLKGVRVDSVTEVENFMLKNDQIRLQAEGFIQGSVELKQLRRYLSDGSIEVTVAMNLSGDFLSLMLSTAEEQRKEPAKISTPPAELKPEKRNPPLEPPQTVSEGKAGPLPPPAILPEKKVETPVPSAKTMEPPLPAPSELPKFTGLVIDSRGLGMKPALITRILDENGQELYRGNFVPQERAAQNGLALFARDLTAAQTNPRVGKNPLTLKGFRVDPANPADIILAKEEAQKLAPFAQKGTFLADCRVLIVLD
jgi:hypothetical protein